MEEKIKNLTKDLKFLKDLFLAQAQTKAEKLTNAELRRLLAGMSCRIGQTVSLVT